VAASADQDSKTNRFVAYDWFRASNYDGPRLMRPGGFSEIACCRHETVSFSLFCALVDDLWVNALKAMMNKIM
jgi:hypothetical protein